MVDSLNIIYHDTLVYDPLHNTEAIDNNTTKYATSCTQ